MRNGTSFAQIAVPLVFASLLLLSAAGCTSPQKKAAAPVNQHAALDAGYIALESQQYNDALAKADQVLAAGAHGPNSAAALYLKGRAFGREKRRRRAIRPGGHTKSRRRPRRLHPGAGPNPPSNPSRPTSAPASPTSPIFRTIIPPPSASGPPLTTSSIAMTSKHGLSIASASPSSAKANSPRPIRPSPPSGNFIPIPSPPSRQRTPGARSFYVQLATFASAKSADAAIAQLQREGINAVRTTDAASHSLVPLGPIASYKQAEYFKDRLAAKYPNALVLP